MEGTATAPAPTPKLVTVSTYLPPEQAVTLKRLADDADRSIAAELRRAVRQYLEGLEERGT